MSPCLPNSRRKRRSNPRSRRMTSTMVGQLLLSRTEDGSVDHIFQEAPYFRYLGTLHLLYPVISAYDLTKRRPVIVAEHMLGCAMYELVSTSIKANPLATSDHHVFSRSMSDMTTLWAKLLGSKATKLRYRCMRRQVRRKLCTQSL